jgi:hypothetical protein
MRSRALGHRTHARALALAALIALGSAGAIGGQGDVTISGTLRFDAVLKPGGGPESSYETSVSHYVFEAGPTTAGTVQAFDHEAVLSLCADKDGCQITLQMFDWDPANEPGATASKTTWLFLSEVLVPESPTQRHWRFDEAVDKKGVDDDGMGAAPPLTLYDCSFGDGESTTSENQPADFVPGFGLLNCSADNLSCTFSDTTTVCRVVLSD